MPKAIEAALMRAASKYARSGKLHKKAGESTKSAKDRFVYGTLRHKFGWKPSTQK